MIKLGGCKKVVYEQNLLTKLKVVLMSKQGVTVVILAGGQGRRMGGQDKGWVEYEGKPMIQHILERLTPQADEVIIIANRNQPDYEALGVPVFADFLEGFQGPLVGIATGLKEAQYDLVVFVPCDGPFISPELVKAFSEQYKRFKKPVIVANDGNRLQPMVVMIEKQLLPHLLQSIEAGERKPDRWYASVGMDEVSFEPQSLHNFNTPEQINIRK